MRTAIRATSAGILIASIAGVLVVQYLWRPAVGADGSTLAAILGGMPNLIAGIGLPFLWVVLRGRSRPAPDLTRFGWFAVGAFAILLNHEYWRPGFDWSDIAATVAGVVIAWLVYAALWTRLGSAPGTIAHRSGADETQPPAGRSDPVLRVESR